MTWEKERKRIWALVLELQRRVKALEEQENKGQEQPAKPACLDMEKGVC